MIVEVGRKMRERGRRQRVTSRQPQPQHPTPHGDRRIMRRTKAQGRDARGGVAEGGGEGMGKKPLKSCIGRVEKRGKLGWRD